MEISVIGDALARIEVTDEGAATVPRPRCARDGDDDGRGLRLVERLSVRWGVGQAALGGTVVWSEVFTMADNPTVEGQAGLVVREPVYEVEV